MGIRPVDPHGLPRHRKRHKSEKSPGDPLFLQLSSVGKSHGAPDIPDARDQGGVLIRTGRSDMKIPAIRFILALSVAAMTTQCGNTNDLPKYQTLGGLRILTIVVSAPEANPGDTVTFTPVLSDLNGSGRTINYAVQACIDPGIGNGADPVCLNPDPSSMQTG